MISFSSPRSTPHINDPNSLLPVETSGSFALFKQWRVGLRLGFFSNLGLEGMQEQVLDSAISSGELTAMTWKISYRVPGQNSAHFLVPGRDFLLKNQRNNGIIYTVVK